MSTAKNRNGEVISNLEDALRVLSLPNVEVSDRQDGETGASYPYKCGYARAAIRAALEELRKTRI
jgi:hypothetical protein